MQFSAQHFQSYILGNIYNQPYIFQGEAERSKILIMTNFHVGIACFTFQETFSAIYVCTVSF